MKYFIFLLLFASMSCAYSQNKTMIDSITTTKNGGKVVIHQDVGIANLVGKINTTGSTTTTKKVNKRGYRIQAYSGSQQKVAKTEVYEREKRFRNRFPAHSTYVTFNSPFWKLRIGDFAEQRDADEILKEFKKAFPEYSGELYIVPDNVRVFEH